MKKLMLAVVVSLIAAGSAHADIFELPGTPFAIPDSSGDFGTSFDFDFPPNVPGGIIESIKSVTVNIDHTWAGDVSLQLIAPDGQNFVLFDGDVGGSADLAGDYVFVETGGAAAGSYATGAGTYDAFSWGQGPFSKNGWQWQVGDDAGGDLGVVNSITVDFNKAVAIPEPTSTLALLGLGGLALIRRKR